MTARCSEQERQIRIDLAACYRLMPLFGMSDLIYNHITARVPGTDDEILINPYGLMYEEMTASSMVKINLNGDILDNPNKDMDINKAGYVIHSAVHGARHDVGCVIHTHSRAGMAVSAMKQGLLPLTQTSMRFRDIRYHDYESVAVDLEERERLVQDLGDQDAMILRNHGLLVASSSIPEAFNTMYWLEMACRVQVDALGSGLEINMPSQEVIDKTHYLYLPTTRRRFGLLEWPAMLRYLDRRNPGYAD
ncbi:class II aldolase/adducin family protein [Allopusillimonas soli]|uniref:Class II aldolase/adducin family protein n=1 Tax=Allopusillimonas soli TaxID=659016 RepID=A0A853FFT9_9BURK|nr:class II aldolase/adducin family protein [Allopusillimonas soli]NYT37361.1 class II aldolase/adducin family protein [Allopusillimonas soli]TEA74657.1 class II aldolase/adducin family protein [Allopusillimonas soli]